MNIKVALAQDFLANLSKLSSSIQSKVLKWALKFQNNPTSSGINYETIRKAKDKNLRSVRIDNDWRGIVFKPDTGDVYVLMYVDKHDEAYRWAESRRVAINQVTGAMQLFVVENRTEEEPTQHLAQSPDAESPQKTAPLYLNLSDSELLSIGTPEDMIPRVRAIHSEQELDNLQPVLPVEAYEGLFLIAAGDSVSDVLNSRETRVDQKIDTRDFAKALETPESQSRFIVVADPETMTAILNAPLAQWRVFLHPTQRKLANAQLGGPARILGGAGTGKTVLAMHRAKWLAENQPDQGRPILVTTFTQNLAKNIEDNLRNLCTKEVMDRILVQNLDAWVNAFLRKQRYEYRIIYKRQEQVAAECWQIAKSQADSSLGLSDSFYEEEWENVVLAQGISSRDEYRLAKRKGRRTILNRSKRDAIWPVFEEYRNRLTLKKLKEVEDAFRDAAALLKNQGPVFQSIIIDETQDFGAQALVLLRAMVAPGPNDLFFVGDGHQRIYNRNSASMSACGIDIRGRGKKLYLNYRTTEQIRHAAVALLEDCEVDDLDEGADEVRRYKSVSRGENPKVYRVAHLEEGLKIACQSALDALKNDRSICILVSTKQEGKDLMARLCAEGIEARSIGPNQSDLPDSTAVRVATMHRAKGLEFDEVVVVTHPISENETSPFDRRRLLYVAITRAKTHASLIYVG
jgi:hypothetical protein